jgi:hypothetical protein
VQFIHIKQARDPLDSLRLKEFSIHRR